MPLISIITVCKNDCLRLKLTIQSVIQFKNHCPGIIEFVVVDGNSVDGTSRLIAENQWVIDKTITGDDVGIYDAMNIGTKIASSPWLLFLNAGDTLLPQGNFIKAIWHEISNNSLNYIIFDVIQYYSNGVSRLLKAGSPSNLRNGSQFCHQGVLIRRARLIEFPYSLKYRYCSDFHHFMTQYKINPASFIRLRLHFTAVEAGGLSDSLRIKIIDEWISIISHESQSIPYSLILKKLVFILARPFWGSRASLIAVFSRKSSY